MMIKFRCASCGEENVFDPEEPGMQKAHNLRESQGDSGGEFLAYCPTCKFCGEVNRIQPPRGKS